MKERDKDMHLSTALTVTVSEKNSLGFQWQSAPTCLHGLSRNEEPMTSILSTSIVTFTYKIEALVHAKTKALFTSFTVNTCHYYSVKEGPLPK